MIKFFRTIRKDLMEKNKTGKYLKYAIGEIILVVIGILIALSINNWNENHKDRQEENNYLIGIKEDLQKDLSFLLDIKKDLEARKLRQEIVDSLYSSGILQENQIREFRVRGLKNAHTTFMSTPGNYNSLVSEGRISLIQNRDLHSDIQQIYERMYPRIEKRGDRLDAIAVQISWDHRHHMKHGRFTLKYLHTSGYVEDIHRFHDEIDRYLIELVDELVLFLPKVIKMIEKELENN